MKASFMFFLRALSLCVITASVVHFLFKACPQMQTEKQTLQHHPVIGQAPTTTFLRLKET